MALRSIASETVNSRRREAARPAKAACTDAGKPASQDDQNPRPGSTCVPSAATDCKAFGSSFSDSEDGRRDLRGADGGGVRRRLQPRIGDEQAKMAVVRRIAAVFGIACFAARINNTRIGLHDDVRCAALCGVSNLAASAAPRRIEACDPSAQIPVAVHPRLACRVATALAICD